MGFSNGSMIAEALIKEIEKEVVDASLRKRLYTCLLDTLEDADWDCAYETEGISEEFDQLLKERGLLDEEHVEDNWGKFVEDISDLIYDVMNGCVVYDVPKLGKHGLKLLEAHDLPTDIYRKVEELKVRYNDLKEED